jgi:hypothetical protein
LKPGRYSGVAGILTGGAKDTLGPLKQRTDWCEAGVQEAKRTVRRGYAYGLLSFKTQEHRWTPKRLKLQGAGFELNGKIAEIGQ